MHVTIVTSFLLLAATGLPLKFAEAPWAPEPDGGWSAAPQTAGVLHRVAAIVTFGYFAWHLGALAYGLGRARRNAASSGARARWCRNRATSLDLWAMMKYFLYLGPRPKFDRFTYWEKFDYMGVFWGVAVIGISGLVLWLPTFATTFLPGWVLNAAYVIHSDEALLATGFIFLFHFFHTHLRPEAFPMDTVVFTGRMPLETFKEERPLEYATARGTGQARRADGAGADRGRAHARLHLRFHDADHRHRAGRVHLLGAAGRYAALNAGAAERFHQPAGPPQRRVPACAARRYTSEHRTQGLHPPGRLQARLRRPLAWRRRARDGAAHRRAVPALLRQRVAAPGQRPGRVHGAARAPGDGHRQPRRLAAVLSRRRHRLPVGARHDQRRRDVGRGAAVPGGGLHPRGRASRSPT